MGIRKDSSEAFKNQRFELLKKEVLFVQFEELLENLLNSSEPIEKAVTHKLEQLKEQRFKMFEYRKSIENVLRNRQKRANRAKV